MSNLAAPPFQVTWTLTERCDLRCRHCIVPVRPVRDVTNEADTRTAMRFVESLWDNDVCLLSFGGGEPTVRPDFFAIARHARNIGLTVLTSTNAQRLDEAMLDRFEESGFQCLQVSLDGLTADTHEAVRGPGTFGPAMRGLELLLGRPLMPVLAIAVHRRLLPELDRVIDFAIAHSLYALKVQPIANPFRYADGTRGDLTEAEAVAVARRCHARLRGTKVKLSVSAWLMASIGKERASSCAGDMRSGLVDARGGVSLCDERPGIGNAFDGSFLEHWTSAVDRARRERSCGCFALRRAANPLPMVAS